VEHHFKSYAKFCANTCHINRAISIKQIFKMATATILDFLRSESEGKSVFRGTLFLIFVPSWLSQLKAKDSSFPVRVIVLWNTLAKSVVSAPSLLSFKLLLIFLTLFLVSAITLPAEVKSLFSQ